MKIALAQINPTVGDFDGNRRLVLEALAAAEAGGAALAIFPELALCGYPPKDLLERPAFVEAARASLDALAAARAGGTTAALVGFPERSETADGHGLYNSAALIDGGRVAHIVRKSLLPTYDVFDERRYFDPATEVAPISFRGRNLGISICEDIWNDADFWPARLYRSDPIEALVRAGAEIILNLSASPFTIEKRHLRPRMLAATARRWRRPLLFVNQVGGQDDLVFDGASLALDATGQVMARGAEHQSDLIIVDVSERRFEDRLRRRRAAAASKAPTRSRRWRPSRSARATTRAAAAFRARCSAFPAASTRRWSPAWPPGPSGRRTCWGSPCRRAIRRPARWPTPRRWPGTWGSTSPSSRSNRCSPLTSRPWRRRWIGSPRPARPQAAEAAADLTAQNLQARVRGAILMALSNRQDRLLLSTGNKSEIATGYCTLYGDMAGGLAVISDVPKTLVYRLARAVNDERIVIPEATLTKPPSAELRPNQTDQDSLPPYDLLDAILDAHLVRGLDVPALVAQGFDAAVARDVVRRVQQSEYKRRQMAPGLKITGKSFGPGRRYPIAPECRSCLLRSVVLLVCCAGSKNRRSRKECAL